MQVGSVMSSQPMKINGTDGETLTIPNLQYAVQVANNPAQDWNIAKRLWNNAPNNIDRARLFGTSQSKEMIASVVDPTTGLIPEDISSFQQASSIYQERKLITEVQREAKKKQLESINSSYNWQQKMNNQGLEVGQIGGLIIASGQGRTEVFDTNQKFIANINNPNVMQFVSTNPSFQSPQRLKELNDAGKRIYGDEFAQASKTQLNLVASAILGDEQLIGKQFTTTVIPESRLDPITGKEVKSQPIENYSSVYYWGDTPQKVVQTRANVGTIAGEAISSGKLPEWADERTATVFKKITEGNGTADDVLAFKNLLDDDRTKRIDVLMQDAGVKQKLANQQLFNIAGTTAIYGTTKSEKLSDKLMKRIASINLGNMPEENFDKAMNLRKELDDIINLYDMSINDFNSAQLEYGATIDSRKGTALGNITELKRTVETYKGMLDQWSLYQMPTYYGGDSASFMQTSKGPIRIDNKPSIFFDNTPIFQRLFK